MQDHERDGLDAAIAADWDGKARDWDRQVGEDGDDNRRMNSDPVLWRLLGDVRGRRVLDAGCGTGYLSRKLALQGAHVVGIDVSPAMIAIASERARARELELEHRVDSAASLATISAGCIDALVSNYVLMDLPDLAGAARAMARVLIPGGVAVLVFSHPCFPLGGDTVQDRALRAVTYHWRSSYFVPGVRTDPPWRHFTTPFTWFHRPLSTYVGAFRAAGLLVDALEEPHAEGEYLPCSVAFRLVKPR
jgi:SAM-dependent methyltransferase